MAWKSKANPAAAPAAAPAHPLPPPVAATAAPATAVTPAPAFAAAPATAVPMFPGDATLPPVQPAAPVQPVQAAPAPARAPARTEPIAAAAVPAVAVPRGFMSLFTKPAGAPSAMQAILAAAAAKGEPNLFPTVEVTGGDQGGMFDLDPMNEEGSDADLVTGRRAINGIYLGYRLLTLCWPKAFVTGGPKQTPKWRAQVDERDAVNADLLARAAKNIQFTKKDNRHIFDPVGHTAIAVEYLLYDGRSPLSVIRTTWSFESVGNSMASLAAAISKAQAETGFTGDRMLPVSVSVATSGTSNKDKSQAWKEHSLHFAFDRSPALATTMQQFQEFFAQSGEDPDLIKALSDWQKTTLTAEQADVLRQVSELG